MELFAKLFGSLLVFVYHCFDRIVIHGYLSGRAPSKSRKSLSRGRALANARATDFVDAAIQ